ncbi:MAG: SGNH/GDSL hydrolase family protein [Chitinispirillaceae bacterium]|nr:SGNH/GDSL hydrolase family protein [Chitinispirillaceae bacterium]
MAIKISKNTHILFIGDSITDCNRSSSNKLGNGYVSIINNELSKRYPSIKITNRGVSGDTIKELAARWKEDCIDLKPDIISILIGINDTWQKYLNGVETPIETFEEYYRNILDKAVVALNPAIVLCEPFLLPLNDEQKLWHLDLDPKRRLIKGLSIEYNAIFVPLQEIFKRKSEEVGVTSLVTDGIHPTPKGHKLIAEMWIRAVLS